MSRCNSKLIGSIARAITPNFAVHAAALIYGVAVQQHKSVFISGS
jgi:hypothetical protein